MHAVDGVASRARWEVIWIKDKRRVRKSFGTDLSGATKLYAKVSAAGRSGVTLRCCNIGFPPPDKYADREEVIIFVGGKRKRARRMVEPKLYRVRMGELNARGIWWCPFCCEMRRFVFRKGFKLNGLWVPEEGMYCPMCDISHNNWHVKHYNPKALSLEMRPRVTDPKRETKQALRRRERRERRKREQQKENA